MRVRANRLAFLALLSAGCSEEPAAKLPEPEQRTPDAPAAPPPPAAPDGPSPPTGGGEDAAQVLETYYSLIETRRYDEAYQLREPAPGAPTAAEFAASFEPFAEHRATIGKPSEPVESEGWIYVEVPVHRYGRMKDGSPLASGGTLTLRRRKDAHQWRIFTKG